MKNIKLMYLAIALLTIIASDSALAWHRHSHFNLGINLGYPGYYYGPGFYGGYGFGGYGFGGYGYGYGYPFYYPSYAYPPTVVVVPTTPPVYTQQQQAQQVQPVQPQTDYWHYCQKPQGYYPYVKNCPGGWLQVAPQPPAQ